jgi:hypothetical protein
MKASHLHETIRSLGTKSPDFSQGESASLRTLTYVPANDKDDARENPTRSYVYIAFFAFRTVRTGKRQATQLFLTCCATQAQESLAKRLVQYNPQRFIFHPTVATLPS